MVDNYKDFCEILKDIDKLRERYHKMSLLYPRSVVRSAKEIGISFDSLHSFIYKKKRTSYETLYKIYAYILEKEKECDIVTSN